jgi:hypothetical protein
MKELHKKLVTIQTELKAPKNQFNSFGKYKYRNIEDIQEAVKPHLLNHGLALTFTDKVSQVGDMAFIESTAILSDGEHSLSASASAGVEPRKGMDLAQTFGASSSYARKYAAGGLFLLDDTKDADATNEGNVTAPPKKKVLVINKHNKNMPTSDGLKMAIEGWGSGKKEAIEKWLTEKVCFTADHWKQITGTDWVGGDKFPV